MVKGLGAPVCRTNFNTEVGRGRDMGRKKKNADFPLTQTVRRTLTEELRSEGNKAVRSERTFGTRRRG